MSHILPLTSRHRLGCLSSPRTFLPECSFLLAEPTVVSCSNPGSESVFGSNIAVLTCTSCVNLGKVPEMSGFASSTGYWGGYLQAQNANMPFMKDSLLMTHELGLLRSQEPYSFLSRAVELKNWLTGAETVHSHRDTILLSKRTTPI